MDKSYFGPRVQVNDIWDKIMEDRERWQKERRVGRVSVDKDDIITFHHDEVSTTYRYWLPLDRFKTPEGQMQQLNHLRHKRWFDRAYFNDLMDCLERLGLVDGLDN